MGLRVDTGGVAVAPNPTGRPLGVRGGASGGFVGSGTQICPVGERRWASGRFVGRLPCSSFDREFRPLAARFSVNGRSLAYGASDVPFGWDESSSRGLLARERGFGGVWAEAPDTRPGGRAECQVPRGGAVGSAGSLLGLERATEDLPARLLCRLEGRGARVDAWAADPHAEPSARPGLELGVGEVGDAVGAHAA